MLKQWPNFRRKWNIRNLPDGLPSGKPSWGFSQIPYVFCWWFLTHTPTVSSQHCPWPWWSSFLHPHNTPGSCFNAPHISGPISLNSNKKNQVQNQQSETTGDFVALTFEVLTQSDRLLSDNTAKYCHRPVSRPIKSPSSTGKCPNPVTWHKRHSIT